MQTCWSRWQTGSSRDLLPEAQGRQGPVEVHVVRGVQDRARGLRVHVGRAERSRAARVHRAIHEQAARSWCLQGGVTGRSRA
eukprot:2250193-Prymnesium_polylepis.1